jgi:hypothetical protein
MAKDKRVRDRENIVLKKEYFSNLTPVNVKIGWYKSIGSR